MTDAGEPKNFPGNSYSGKARAKNPEATSPEREKLESVVSGNVVKRRKPLGKKLAEAFAGDDARTVGGYLFTDVVVPAIKSLILDAITEGGQRLLFGGSGGSRSSHGRRIIPSNTNAYNRMSSGGSTVSSGGRNLSASTREVKSFDEIVLDSREEADLVLEKLVDYVSEYGAVRVADLYDAVGMTPNMTDEQWGWKDLRTAHVRRVREGWLIEMPPTISID